ncbi:Hypothetical_protein [Hexamita inflata]|uniref:Hypothetical_protein n=1 Tax=Hexamita inflata TaxID=28002 RepID=A0AA86U464_9EUKA|nr:Hypothetical protein HINF_LOCUS24962 [Hexamita inflata]
MYHSIQFKSIAQLQNKISLIAYRPSIYKVCMRDILSQESIRSSYGNISLIGSQNGSLNIRNYQVAGTYYSKQCMSLCVLNSYQAQISITNVNYKPNYYTFGNQSSYLFAYVSNSSVQIKQLVLSVGSSSVNSLQTTQTSTNSNQFQYGGIITQINASSVIIHNSAVQAHLKQTTNYLNSSGMIVGSSNFSIISINNLCAFEQTTFSNSVVNLSGLFGAIGGKISFMNVKINYSASGNGLFSNFGIIGVLTVDCTVGLFNNLQINYLSTQKSSYSDNEINIAALIGSCNAKQVLLNQSNFQSNISAASDVSVVCGYQNSSFSINNIEIINSNVISLSSVSSSIGGGVFGCIDGISIKLNYLQIVINMRSLSINSESYCSGILGYSTNVVNISIYKCYIYNSSVQSTSQNNGQALASGIIASSNQQNIKFQQIQIDNISIISKSQNNFGISAGYIALLTSSNVYCSQLNITNSLIQSNSCAAMSAGIMGMFNYSNLIMQNTQVFNSIIFGSDEQYSNISLNTIRQASGVLSFVYHSQIQISKTSIQGVNITMISNLNKAATGGITGWLLFSNSTQKQIEIIDIYQLSNSLEYNSHSGGFNSIVDQSYDQQFNNTISNSVIITINQVYNPLGSTAYSYTGSVIGYTVGSSILLQNMLALQMNLTSNGVIGSYCGGLVDIITGYNDIKTQLTLIYNDIFNINIVSISTVDAVAGSAIGFITYNSNITIDQLIIHNTIINVSAKYVFAGSFAGSQWSQYNNSFVQIFNSEIYSVQIFYQNQMSTFINLILRPQWPLLTNSQIKISSTKSLGFSSINGIPVSNCENVQVQYINGNNFISESGCV